jgi:hypothetical protein
MSDQQPPRTYTRIAAAIVLAAVVVAGAILATSTHNTTVTSTAEITATTQTSTTTVVSTSFATTTTISTSVATSHVSFGSAATCAGSPQGGGSNAAGPTWNVNLPITVNYTGPWTLTYQGYDSLGRSNPTNTSGSCSGTGFYSLPVSVSGPTSDSLTLCAQAQKLDSSDATMILTITGDNETSLPNGSVSYCGGEIP